MFPIAGIVGLPYVVNISSGDGPSFMGLLVTALSRQLGHSLRFVEQNNIGVVMLAGFNGGNLSFMPHSFVANDSRSDGMYPAGNGQYTVVIGGQSLVLAPAVVRLDQLSALLPGVAATVGDNGVITASFNGQTYVVQPGIAVALEAPTGSARLVTGSDGLLHFIDAQGYNQVLYPAFDEPNTLRNILLSLDLAASLNIQLDGTAGIVLNGKRYTLVPDATLGGIPSDRMGQAWWQESAVRYRFGNVVRPGTSQGFVLRP